MVTFPDDDGDLKSLHKNLFEFAQRVASDASARPEELRILPEIVRLLYRITD